MPYTADMDALCAQLRAGELGRRAFIDACARVACRSVHCSSAGLWVLPGAADKALRSLGMYERASGALSQVDEAVPGDSGAFIEALRRGGKILAVDTATDPATRGFHVEALQPHGIVSLMSIGFSLNGALFGAFTCAQVGEAMRWSPRQLEVVTRIGSRATLALASASPNQLDTLFGNL